MDVRKATDSNVKKDKTKTLSHEILSHINERVAKSLVLLSDKAASKEYANEIIKDLASVSGDLRKLISNNTVDMLGKVGAVSKNVITIGERIVKLESLLEAVIKPARIISNAISTKLLLSDRIKVKGNVEAKSVKTMSGNIRFIESENIGTRNFRAYSVVSDRTKAKSITTNSITSSTAIIQTIESSNRIDANAIKAKTISADRIISENISAKQLASPEIASLKASIIKQDSKIRKLESSIASLNELILKSAKDNESRYVGKKGNQVINGKLSVSSIAADSIATDALKVFTEALIPIAKYKSIDEFSSHVGASANSIGLINGSLHYISDGKAVSLTGAEKVTSSHGWKDLSKGVEIPTKFDPTGSVVHVIDTRDRNGKVNNCVIEYRKSGVFVKVPNAKSKYKVIIIGV